jgi:hypothetical protein
MRGKAYLLLGLAAAGYWASQQPGGVPGTLRRLTQGLRDVAAGQDPSAVWRRFVRGTDEEPAGLYTEELAPAPSGGYQSPYRDWESAV